MSRIPAFDMNVHGQLEYAVILLFLIHDNKCITFCIKKDISVKFWNLVSHGICLGSYLHGLCHLLGCWNSGKGSDSSHVE